MFALDAAVWYFRKYVDIWKVLIFLLNSKKKKSLTEFCTLLTEMYGHMWRTLVFKWHKRFNGGWKNSVQKWYLDRDQNDKRSDLVMDYRAGKCIGNRASSHIWRKRGYFNTILKRNDNHWTWKTETWPGIEMCSNEQVQTESDADGFLR